MVTTRKRNYWNLDSILCLWKSSLPGQKPSVWSPLPFQNPITGFSYFCGRLVNRGQDNHQNFLDESATTVIILIIFFFKFSCYLKSGVFDKSPGLFSRFAVSTVVVITFTSTLLWIFVDILSFSVVLVNPAVVALGFLLRFELFAFFGMIQKWTRRLPIKSRQVTRMLIRVEQSGEWVGVLAIFSVQYWFWIWRTGKGVYGNGKKAPAMTGAFLYSYRCIICPIINLIWFIFLLVFFIIAIVKLSFGPAPKPVVKVKHSPKHKMTKPMIDTSICNIKLSNTGNGSLLMRSM